MKLDFLSLDEFSTGQIHEFLDRADYMKRRKDALTRKAPLKGKTIGMIFRKHSTRTRISFEVAMVQLGGYPMYLQPSDLQISRGESISDTARIFSVYLDGIVIRTYSHSEVEELAKHSTIPVINALTDKYHPCQILADLYTIRSKFGKLAGLRMAYVGDGNNVAHSLLLGAAKTGMDIAVCSPEGYRPEADVVASARAIAKKTGASIEITSDPRKGVKGADVIYTDVFTSMGQEAESKKRLKAFQGYCVDSALVGLASKRAVVMHCLPAHRGEEITSEVLDGKRSIVIEQAANRLPVQKAILEKLLAGAGGRRGR